jgi:hypothetical protein
MKKNPWRILAAAAIVAAGFAFVLCLFIAQLSDKNAAGRDFIEYWASAQLLVHGANPYDPAAILRIERTVGLDRDEPKVTPSPPLILLLALPLGFVSAKTGLILWLLALLACLMASILLLWHLNGCPPSGYHWIGIAFAPALASMMAGQISIFLLLALVLFLYWNRSRPWLTGAVLLPCALKPHLFLPFAMALLLWVISRKAYRILAGFAAALAVSYALTLYLDHNVWAEYVQLSHSMRVLSVFIPTLSESFRFLVNRDTVWLQFVPAAVACVWAIWYFWTRRDRWNWMDQGMLVLLVSVVCAPYAFFYDEAVLLPAVLVSVYRADSLRHSLLPFALIAGAALFEVMAAIQLTSSFYLWTAPAWLAWYLYATWEKGAAVQECG